MFEAIADALKVSEVKNFDALIDIVNASTKEASDALDDALAFIRESNKHMAALDEETE